MNNSLIHEDFMIGTADMEIIGVDSEGNETLLWKMAILPLLFKQKEI